MRIVKRLLFCVWMLGVVACTHTVVDEVYSARGQDSRIKYIIIHYTGENQEDSLRILTEQQVSAHYLITDESPVRVLQLVPESQRAWHSGESYWGKDSQLNGISIGIEIVNSGQRKNAMGDEAWQPYSSEQIERLILLLKDIQQRHQIIPEHILGHSDVAPLRKIDPGPNFPWQWLAQEGLGRWYDEDRVAQLMQYYQQKGLPSAEKVQQNLRKLGYFIEPHGKWDSDNRKVLQAFQMHYRPLRYDGVLDVQTAAIIEDLIQTDKKSLFNN
ncbi:N-acetylmuramoyl-L-alanine amidase [Pelistega ratti]|uniref:N-acetylmuramoyl-L-alanine amidase n=1 Tax=Pelistega ratti TaxID=2652177 RepID=UPI00135A00D1|nr:N-acetylmuramoyl-L-alanine amidase [Pelistega ratti]